MTVRERPASADDLQRIAEGATSPGSSGALIVRQASGIEPRPVEWIWTGRIARGKHTAIAGEPGTGKSTLTMEIAATISVGGAWPCDEGRSPSGSVLMLSAEDDAEHTLVPRLMAAGADLSRLYILEAVRADDGRGTRTFNLQADLARLEEKIAEIGDVALVIIDPISSYMGRADSHKNAEVRGVLEPVSKMAERTGVAFLSVTHFSKSGAGGGKALHKFTGSIAYVAASRFAFAVMADPQDEDRRLFLHVKNNLAAPPQGLAFRLGQRIVGDPRIGSHVMWESEPVALSANDVLAAEASGGESRSETDDWLDFLADILANGAVKVVDVEREARAAGLLDEGRSLRQSKPARRAQKRLDVKSKKDGYQGEWTWSLPSKAPSDSKGAPTNIGAPLNGKGAFGTNDSAEPRHSREPGEEG